MRFCYERRKDRKGPDDNARATKSFVNAIHVSDVRPFEFRLLPKDLLAVIMKAEGTASVMQMEVRICNENNNAPARRNGEGAAQVLNKAGERKRRENGIISVIYGSQRCAKLNVPRGPVHAIIGVAEIGGAINVLTAIYR